MTIAISAKVNDGVVLAADSATTVITANNQVINVYNNANKIFNLYKGCPIGVLTWGAGSIGQASIATAVKDFRRDLEAGVGGAFDPQQYELEELSQRFLAFVRPRYEEAFGGWANKPLLGFMVVGYSPGSSVGEEWHLQLPADADRGFVRVRGPNEVGVTWNGDTEAITRLVVGFGTNFGAVLAEAGLDQETQQRVFNLARTRLASSLLTPPMPIQDVLDLAKYLVETAVGYSKFRPGATTVGGPIELAAITKHEGFKWVSRKHYFDRSLNLGTEA